MPYAAVKPTKTWNSHKKSFFFCVHGYKPPTFLVTAIFNVYHVSVAHVLFRQSEISHCANQDHLTNTIIHICSFLMVLPDDDDDDDDSLHQQLSEPPNLYLSIF